MSIGPVARGIITLFLIALLIPAQGLAWSAPFSGRRDAGAADAIAWRTFMTALNATDQEVMTGPGRPQLYLVFNVDVAVPAINAPLFTAEDLKWFDEFMNQIANQAATATAAAAEPNESILDEIEAADAQVRSLPLAKQLASIPDRLNFERNPYDAVPVEQSMSIAMTDALETAGIDANRYGGTSFKRGTGTVTYEGERFDGQIIMTGRLVDGQIVLTKEFKPLTRSGGLGDTITIRGTGTPPTPVIQTTGGTEPAVSDTATTTAGTTLVATLPTADATITRQLRIVASNGTPGDAVYKGQPFQLEATMPAEGAPRALTATLTTADGQEQTVNLIRTGTRDGVASYTSAEVSFHGGRLAQGTLSLDVTNGQIVTVNVAGAGQAGVAVFTDDIQLGISRVNEALRVTADELIRQRNFVDTQMKVPAVAADPAQMATLRQWRTDVDNKLAWISETRRLMAGTDQPGLQLMYGHKRFEWMSSNWDEFYTPKYYGDTVIQEQFKEHKGELFTDVMRGFTMGTYQQVARMSLVAQLRTVFTGYNEFGKKLTYEELLAENRGLAFDLAMFWVPGKFTDSLVNGGFSGELVISAGMPGGKVLVPVRQTTGGGGTPSGGGRAVTATPTPRAGPVVVAGDKPPTTTTKPPTAFNEDPVIPRVDRGLDGKPGAAVTRLSDAEIASNAADDLAELTEIYNKNLTAARAAGVPETRVKQIVGDGDITSEVAELLYREATVREGKVIIPRSEFATLSGINVRNQKGGLSEADYEFLRNRLAQDPTYVDNLPNRGGMPQETGVGDGFTPALTSAQRDALLQNPRVAQMVGDAKSAAAANSTVIMPGGAQPATGAATVRDLNATTLDPNQTTLNPNQTIIVDPNTPPISLPPGTQKGVAGAADNTGTIIVPRDATRVDPTIKIDPRETAPTVRFGPEATAPTVRIGPEATAPTVRIGPEATAPTMRLDPIATERMTDELMQSLPKARQAGQSPAQAANAVGTTLSKLGVGPQQLIASLRERLSAARPVSFSELGDAATAQSRRDVAVSIDALGVSSGVAFNVSAINNGTMPIRLQGEGIVVEPVRGGPSISSAGSRGAAGDGVSAARAGVPQVITEPVEAFCLERLRPVAPAGTQYRVAPPALQAQHRRLVDILHAAKRVMDASGLHPDSDPKTYFNFIRQWSMWSRQENFDEKKFTEEFMNQTKKNVEGQGAKWTGAMQDTVRKAAPGRWRDILRVLDETTKLVPRA